MQNLQTLAAESSKTALSVQIWNDPDSWDDYVNSNPASSNYHRWGWRDAIQATFGHEAYYLAAVNGQRLTGVLPLIHIKSRVFGSPLVSLPFFSYGGVLADDPETRERLLSQAVDLARYLSASHIELRQGHPQAISWTDTTPKVTMEVFLPRLQEALWASLSSGMRNKIRNAKRNEFRIDWGGVNAVPSFYKVFSANMRNLGTPVYPRRWFSQICERFPTETRILTLWDGKEAVASGLITCYRNALELPWSATVSASRKKYSAVFLYWVLLEWAIENGYHKVDFGRCTKGSGVYEFKRHWGSQERPLHWYDWLPAGKPIPELRPENPRYRVATKFWKRLPLPIANLVGPRIVRSIP